MKQQKRSPVKTEGGTRHDSSGRMVGPAPKAKPKGPPHSKPNQHNERVGTSSGPDFHPPTRQSPPPRPVTDRGVATGTLNAAHDAIQRRNQGASTDEKFQRSLHPRGK